MQTRWIVVASSRVNFLLQAFFTSQFYKVGLATKSKLNKEYYNQRFWAKLYEIKPVRKYLSTILL